MSVGPVRSFASSLVALAIISTFNPTWSRAVVGFQPVNSEELKVTSEPLAPGAPAVILYREVDRNDLGRSSHGGVTVMENENLTGRYEDNYVRIKILTEAGRKYADIEIPFAAQFEEIK